MFAALGVPRPWGLPGWHFLSWFEHLYFARLADLASQERLKPDVIQEMDWWVNQEKLADRPELMQLVDAGAAVDVIDAAFQWQHHERLSSPDITRQRRIALTDAERVRKMAYRQRLNEVKRAAAERERGRLNG